MEIVTPNALTWTPGMVARIEAIDIASGATETLLQTNLPIQAPSWSPCGTYLVANAAGRLYRIRLDREKRVMEQILVDRLHASNNDHGISPDGTRLALTDQTEFGRPAIYVMTLNAPFPDLVAASVPAWFHGWSPDSRSITYACIRNERWAIGHCDVAGGRETIVIQAEAGSGHHYNASEFSADGRWIWFNSNRDGAMALWRIRPDASGLQRMTDSDGEDWFPHPSPDGRHVCFLRFAPGPQTAPGSAAHSNDREVALWVMPAEGGAPRMLRAARGRQGMLNAPCWSPDSRRFVYMRYSRADEAPDLPRPGRFRSIGVSDPIEEA